MNKEKQKKYMPFIVFFLVFLLFCGYAVQNNKKQKILDTDQVAKNMEDYLRKKYNSPFKVYNVHRVDDGIEQKDWFVGIASSDSEEFRIWTDIYNDHTVDVRYLKEYDKRINTDLNEVISKYWKKSKCKANLSFEGDIPKRNWREGGNIKEFLKNDNVSLLVDVSIFTDSGNQESKKIKKMMKECYKKGFYGEYIINYHNEKYVLEDTKEWGVPSEKEIREKRKTIENK